MNLMVFYCIIREENYGKSSLGAIDNRIKNNLVIASVSDPQHINIEELTRTPS